MSDSEDLFKYVEEIADQARRRVQALTGAREAPPTDAAPDVFTRHGTGRVDPDSIRSASDLAPYIDHTLLKPEARQEDVVKVAEEARQHGFATVCVNSSHVATVARILAGSSTVPIAVVGFPLGAALSSAKAFEAREAIEAGAREIDMVVNIGALKAKDHTLVFTDIAAVVKASSPLPVKVILETALLSDEEKVFACLLSKAAGAAFVKTSTGFSSGGATVEDVSLMRAMVGEDVGVKASGGIRSSEDAMNMLRAGANRLGASASVAIVTGQVSTAKY
ncbi:deoxyribose-phosphate aldolase [Myxococcus llanfairpwllgwyngyllgogerychwyrndrobwllllantysiliogogogochensis]|uniref:Deoxyribose-phosphate aldolase n=1 Tax=Myxococcus llanfairpwllgwyngyllgogerychwyrndrobwllllantysiliogogogochensis TaxID=2590453 RepID=A0A540WNJ4_9BACT|nr:deoxyribose-phosphate aldolase [Myxococcus llanfairpwllgwyngyllgogerychwyrndrobwllllantysiliogogogochensis]TQF10598.1 deoxyribose-phosphate aldolase [Myxococcus llanfairpwllgwyngyllgogerychwyrndrobwllllantysiliogogogochensis]